MDIHHLALTLTGVVIALVIIFAVAALLSFSDIRRRDENTARIIRKLKDKSGDS